MYNGAIIQRCFCQHLLECDSVCQLRTQSNVCTELSVGDKVRG